MEGLYMRNHLSLTLVSLICCIAFGRELSSTAREETWMTNGSANVIVQDNDKVFLGGGFSYVGPNTGSFGITDTAAGALRPRFPIVNNIVTSIAPDNTGGWYIRGTFSQVGTFQRRNVAYILSDLSVDTAWNPGMQYTFHVDVLLLSGNNVYIGGSFDSIGGQARKNIACLDAATGKASDWNPKANSTVSALAVSGNFVYAGGSFDSIGGKPRKNIACLDAGNGLATDWNPNAVLKTPKSNPYVSINAFSVTGNRIFVCGYFDTIGGKPRKNIACLDAVTGLATSWNPNGVSSNLSGNVSIRALALSGNNAYVGGDFDTIGGQKRQGLACIDTATGSATNWNPANGNAVNVYALSVKYNRVYVGGIFNFVGEKTRINAACLDATSGLACDWNPSTNNYVLALCVSVDNIAVGGYFTSMGGKVRNNIACIDAITGKATAWNPNANKAITALAVSGNHVYAGGSFDSIGNMKRPGLVCLDTVTGLASDWNPNARWSKNPSGPSINCLLTDGNKIYVGGAFDTINGKTRSYIACLDTATGAASDWNPRANYSVNAISIAGNNVYASGDFDTIGNLPRKYIACIDAATGMPLDWNPNLDGKVYALFAVGNKVFTGGNFGVIGGKERQHIACLDAATGVALDWNPGANDFISNLCVYGNDVYAAGRFSIIGGQSRGYIAAIDAATGVAEAWNPSANPGADFFVVHAVSAGEKRVFAGGGFTTIHNAPRVGFAQFDFSSVSVKPSEKKSRENSFLFSVSNRTIRYSVPREYPVSLQVFDIVGRKVATLVNRVQMPGSYSMSIDKRIFTPGFYIVRFKTADRVSTMQGAFIR
jgi:trimeric autotransporter adhesin